MKRFKKKFKFVPSAGTIVVTVVWDEKGVILNVLPRDQQ